MAINVLNIHLTTQGITAYNRMLSGGVVFSISKVELSQNLVPAINPDSWQPDGGIGLPYYVQTTPVVSLSAGADNALVLDMQLNQTIPLTINYAPPSIVNGWVGAYNNYIEIGSFALFVIDPVTMLEVVYCIGYFSPTPIQKFAHSTSTPGNIVDILSNLILTPFSTNNITYTFLQEAQAEAAYINNVFHLPTPQSNIFNAAVVNDISALAYDNNKSWNFSNYVVLSRSLAIDSISGTQLTSADLYNALPVNLQQPTQTFAENQLIGQIVNSSGSMTSCFLINANVGNTFSTNVNLPALQAGDMLYAFIVGKYNSTSQLSTPAVTTLAASTITGNSMLLNADLVSCGANLYVQCSFQYRIAGQSSWLSTATQNLNRYQTFSSTISGLISNTTYEFRAVATGLSNPDSTVYGDILTATTLNVTPSDYVINIVGTTGSASNDPLNTTTVPSVVNGSVSNTTATITASADSCVATTKEYSEPSETFVDINTLYQVNPLKLAIDGATTNTSIVVTSPIAGLLANGSTLWCDDGGTMVDVTAGNVVESNYDNTTAPWVLQTLPASVNWQAVTYGNGIFVAVANFSTVAATSSDGITWVQRTLPISTGWYSVTYGNGLFVAVGTGGNVAATSPDGITWTQRTLPASANWYSITYGNGIFVAIAGSGSNIAATSPDGITWTQRALPTSANWQSVTYGNGIFNAIAYNSSIAATSPDGITWTQRTLPASAAWYSVTYGNGLFIAVSGISSAVAATSPDGITWTQRTLPANADWRSVTYGNGIFVTVASSASTKSATSPDGITWTIKTMPLPINWVSITYGNGVFVTVNYAATGSTLAATTTAGYIPKYTCTSLLPTLVNTPTWVAKAGQVFKSSVTTSTGTTNFVVDTVNGVTRTGDMLTLTTANRTVNGSYVKLQVGLNQADTCTRLYAGFLV